MKYIDEKIVSAGINETFKRTVTSPDNTGARDDEIGAVQAAVLDSEAMYELGVDVLKKRALIAAGVLAVGVTYLLVQTSGDENSFPMNPQVDAVSNPIDHY